METLARLKFTVPTPIQAQAIPVAIEGKDVIGVAQTGTGKTLAFGIPMLQRLAQVKGQGLVLLPTRELAIQVDEMLAKFGGHHGLRTALVIGGAPMGRQIQQLRGKPHVIIATPGRLNDHLMQHTVKLDAVSILVLDEADRMLDMGFAPQIMKIMKQLPAKRQTMLFSATMPNEIVGIAKAHMQLPVRVEIARPGTAAATVAHEVFFTQRDEKNRLLDKLLNDHRGSVLIFCRTKHGVRKLARAIEQMGHRVTSLHSDRTLGQRRNALEGFKSGQYRVMVATDIAARGIDVTNIELVINYDLPTHAEDYVHRIGRTGRAGRSGQAISFATPDQWGDIKNIERLIRTSLPISHLPELPPGRPKPPRASRPNFSHTRRSHPGRSKRSGGGRHFRRSL